MWLVLNFGNRQQYVSTHMCDDLCLAPEEFNASYFNFLLRGPKVAGESNPLDWLPKSMWNAVQALAQLEDFTKLPADMQEASPRFSISSFGVVLTSLLLKLKKM